MEAGDVTPAELMADIKQGFYVTDLIGSGVPIEGEAGIGYLLRSGYDLPPLMFSRSEITALVTGARMVRSFGGADMALAAEEALIKIAEGEMPVELDSADMQQDARKSIKEKSVTCLECGKTFKILTKRHLATHGLTPEAYREKYGYKKTQALACKSLVRDRRAKMKSMALWERKGQKAEAVQ